MFKLFQAIPRIHYVFLGMSPKINLKLSNLIFKHISVPPNCIRPSILSGTVNQSREDDITILLRMQLGDIKLPEMHNEYARMINPNASCVKSAKDKKFIRGMVQRLAGKKGRFRGNIMGKRTNFTSRTVISPDPYLKIDEVSVPVYCATRLTFTEKVTAYNMAYLKKLVLNGPLNHPGAVAYAEGPKTGPHKPMSHLKVMMTADVTWQKLDKPLWREKTVAKMRIGDFVERHIDNGDVVLFNRQPSLHRLSFQSFKVIVKQAKTFSFNPCCCNPFNADFDGDEMNVHFPQTYEAKSEANELISSIKNITSPNSGEPLTAPLQDILTAAYLLTSKDSFYTREEFLHLALRVLKDIPPGKRFDLPRPAIVKPVRLYTGKQLLSLVLSLTGTWSGALGSFVPDARINHAVEVRPKSGEDLSNDDAFVVIHNSELLLGQLTKKLLGGGSKASVFYRLLRDVGDVGSCRAMERLCQVALTDLKQKGFSIGLVDVTPSAALRVIQRKLVAENFRVCEQFIRSYEDGTMVCDPGCNVEETLESRISSQLSKIRDEGGSQCRGMLPKRNAPLQMALCGSKGSFINISQMVFCVGQQIIEGKRVANVRGTHRTLMFCPINCRAPMSRGFVANSFYSGLNPVEFQFHAMSGREGLIDTAVKTAETGYMQRRLIKCLEDLAVRFDSTVRDFQGNLVQFQYGADGFDPALLETATEPCDFRRELHHALMDFSRADKTVFEEHEARQRMRDLLGRQHDRFPALKAALEETVVAHLHGDIGRAFGVTGGQMALFVANCYRKYDRAVIEPGTAIGVICGQSVGEPATQMTLKTFHFAGVASMNITQGVPRMQEIMNAVANIKTPIITVALEHDRNVAVAKQMQLKIQPVTLGELIAESQEVLCPAGHFFYLHLDGGKLRRLGVTEDHLRVAVATVAVRGYLVSVVFKDNGRMYVELFSEAEINCQLALAVMSKLQVKGAKGVRRTVIQADVAGVHNVFVEGGRLGELLGVPGVDGARTHSNHILETFDVLGIDAAKDVIINEFNAVMGAHNLTPDLRHVMLLADIMCYTVRRRMGWCVELTVCVGLCVAGTGVRVPEERHEQVEE